MNTLYMMIGAPGCGKSTYCSMLISLNDAIDEEHRKNIVRINMDAIRGELCDGNESCQDKNDAVAALARKRLIDALAAGHDVIWDNTSTKAKYRRDVISAAHRTGHRVVGYVFNTPLDVCISRNNGRTRKVPEHIVKDMYNAVMNSSPALTEGFDELILVKD